MGEKEADLYKRPKLDLYRAFYPPIKHYLEDKFDIEVHGAENIPDTPALYVSNHERFEDSLFLPTIFTDQTEQVMRMAGKIEYARGEGLEINGQMKYGRSLKWLMFHAGMIPVDRDGGDPRGFFKMQNAMAYHVAKGESIGMHGEGTRNNDGLLYKIKPGAMRVAMALDIPAVPEGLVYSKYKNGEKTHVDVLFGKIISTDDYKKLPYSAYPKKQQVEHWSNVLEHRIADLTGLKRAGVFAELRKNREEHKGQAKP